MGAFLEKPITDKEFEEGADRFGHKFCVGSMQGWRADQEDAHLAIPDIDETWACYGVFDGHGGPEVSKFVARHLLDCLKAQEGFANGEVTQALQKAFLALDLQIKAEESLAELQQLAHAGNDSDDDDNDSEDDEEDGDNIEALQADADIPIDELKRANGKRADNAGETATDGQLDQKRAKLQALLTGDLMEDDEDDDEDDEDDDDEDDNEEEAKDKDSKQKQSKDGKQSTKEGDDQDQAADDSDEDEEGVEEQAFEHSESIRAQLLAALAQHGEGSEALQAIQSMQEDEAPGYSSGTTANVMLLNERLAIVANAGDCRAVLCRKGVAMDMSEDHKPEDEPERTRIERAGGTVDSDGRIEGGLNLSRALGDWNYKQNAELDHRDQKVSALPDIQVMELCQDDEFIVLACDGIWNSMTSQQVVDYLRVRFTKGVVIKAAITELLDACMAPDTETGDGSGCDNETAMVVMLRDITGKEFHRLAGAVDNPNKDVNATTTL